MTRELKPCPFCGGEGVSKFWLRPDLSGCGSPDRWVALGDKWAFEIRCRDCNVAFRSPELPTYQEALDNAIAAWNRRTP